MGKMGKSQIRHCDRNNAVYLSNPIFFYSKGTAGLHFPNSLVQEKLRTKLWPTEHEKRWFSTLPSLAPDTPMSSFFACWPDAKIPTEGSDALGDLNNKTQWKPHDARKSDLWMPLWRKDPPSDSQRSSPVYGGKPAVKAEMWDHYSR